MTLSQAGKVMRRYGGANASELNKEQFDQLVAELQEEQAKKAAAGDGAAAQGMLSFLPIWRGHERAKALYTNKWVQLTVAVMILGNFFVNIIEKEVDPFPAEMQKYKHIWDDVLTR